MNQAFFWARLSQNCQRELLEYVEQLFSFGVTQTVLSSWHAMGNHDTIRFAGGLENPQFVLHPQVYPYHQAQAPSALSWQRFKQVVAYQFTSFGAPYIYYGDEIGMWSGGVPLNRNPMAWDDQNQEIWDFTRKMISIRKNSQVLNRGNFQVLDLDELERLFGFKRSLQGSVMWMVFNRSSQEKSFDLQMGEGSDSRVFIDYLNPDHVAWRERDQQGLEPVLFLRESGYVVDEGKVFLTIKPWQSMILVEEKEIRAAKKS